MYKKLKIGKIKVESCSIEEEETIFAFQARAERNFRKKMEDKDAELGKAKRALRLEAAKLKDCRERSKKAVEELSKIREKYKGKGASREAYVAILALGRVRKILGY